MKTLSTFASGFCRIYHSTDKNAIGIFAVTPEVWYQFQDGKTKRIAKRLEKNNIFFHFVDYKDAKSAANYFWDEIRRYHDENEEVDDNQGDTN